MAPVRFFGSPRLPLQPRERARLERVAGLPGMAQVVALPDLHIKSMLETPSSLVSALHGGVMLSLSSPSPGCGMALALLPLEEKDLTDPRLDDYFNFLIQRFDFDRRRRTGARVDIELILLHGASAVVEQLGLDRRLIEHIEERGNALESRALSGEKSELLEAAPGFLMALAEREFGQVGAGNHFLELQVVDEVLDGDVAARWGIQLGQVVMMLHADSGRFGAFTGRLYAHRRKNTPRGRLVELRYKLPYHWDQARSPQDACRRLDRYFWPRTYTFLPDDSEEAQQALRAMAIATNYAYANRIAVLATIQEALQARWEPTGTVNLLYDSIHNSIRAERIGGESLWIHRHNASRALPAGHHDLSGSLFYETGQPLLLPGTDQTHSYVCAAGAGTETSLYSIDHGAGRSARLGSRQNNGGHTRLYSYRAGSQYAGNGRGGYLYDRPHWADDGVNEVVRILETSGLARPVVRLRPVAVLKDIMPAGGQS